MLPREVGYARPSSVGEALGLLAGTDGARALAGGQTLVSVMKARAASPEALVDLNGLDELKGIERRADGGLEIGAMTTYTEIIESAEARARPILGEVCAQIADVQVRNRGTIGGNICANDPTNHLPPLMVALGAEMTIAGADGERTVDGRGLLPRRLHDRGRPGRAADEGSRSRRAAATASPRSRSGATGPASSARRSRSTTARAIAVGCVGAVPHRATDVEARLDGDLSLEARQAAAAGPRRDARPARRRPCAGRLPRGTWPRSSSRGRSSRRTSEEAADGRTIETSRRITVEVNGIALRARGRGAAAADPLSPRRPRPDRQPHRLRHGQLRRVQRRCSTACS